MASLFALGVMSIAWMAFVAALIAAWESSAGEDATVTYGTAAILLVLGVLLLADPSAIPGLTIPGSGNAPSMQMPQAHDACTRHRWRKAKGILAERHHIDPEEAFETMRLDARSRRMKLHDLASGIVATAAEATPGIR